MKVVCTSIEPDEKTLAQLGSKYYARRLYAVSTGSEYLVLGLFFCADRAVFGTGTWIIFCDDDDQLSQAPLAMFEIVDPRVSRYWKSKVGDDDVLLAPDPLTRQYFGDDLSEGDVTAITDFRLVRRLLEEEFQAAEPFEGRMNN